MKLIEKYRLDKKISMLERLYLERTMGKGNEPSKAYVIWKHLVDNGPKTVDQLKSELPKDITKFINFFADNNLLNKDGDNISANQDYKWDDVGVIPRTAQQELMNSLRNGDLNDIPSLDDAEAETQTAEEPAPARAPRARRIKANIFSRKVEEVKAALDEGVDVNTRDDKGRTPIAVACMARKGDTGAVIKLLLDNGADPNTYCPRPVVVYTVMYGNKEGTIALADAGADLAVPGKDYRTLMISIITSGLFTCDEVKRMITNDYVKKFMDGIPNCNETVKDIIECGYSNFGKDRSFIDHVVDISFKVAEPDKVVRRLAMSLDAVHLWIITADAIERNGYVMYFHGSSYYAKKIADEKQIADKMYDLAVKVGNGSLKCIDLGALTKVTVAICSQQGKPADVIGKIVTQSTFDELSAKDQWELLQSAVYTAQDFSGTDASILVKALSKLKFKTPDEDMTGNVIYAFCSGDRNTVSHDNDLRRLVCKKLRSYISKIDSHSIKNRIAYSRDPLFIYAMIDAGLGEALANCYGMSDACRSELINAGIIDRDQGRRNLSDNEVLIRDIITHITRDTMSANTRRQINENPAVLADEKIQDALNDPANADSITARQLKRQYDQWAATADKPKYDL